MGLRPIPFEEAVVNSASAGPVTDLLPDHWIFSLLGLAYSGFIVALVAIVILRKRDPAAALGWSLAVAFLPVLGPLLFVLFGTNPLPRRLARKREHRRGWTPTSEAGTAPEEIPELSGEGLAATVRRVARALGEPGRRAGNHLDVLQSGPGAWEAIRGAIEGARHHVHITKYIFREDEVGTSLVDLLLEKAAAGVTVRVIVDAVGSPGRWRIIKRLRKGGAGGHVFMPLIPFGKRFSPNLRNHRKIIVCDGEVAFVGGLNVGEEYLGRRLQRNRKWCDMHVRLTGPAVSDVQAVFAEDWHFCSGEVLPDACSPPQVLDGPSAVQILSGGPDRDLNPIRKAFLLGIAGARKRLLLATPYVVPDRAVRDALKLAALSGVDVRLVTQAWPPDQILAWLCSRSYYAELLEAGVSLYEYVPGMMHAKALAVDGTWAMVGSANLDNRSLHLNFEIMAVLDSAPDVALIEQQLQDIIAAARPLDPARHARRRWYVRLAESVARLLSPLM